MRPLRNSASRQCWKQEDVGGGLQAQRHVRHSFKVGIFLQVRRGRLSPELVQGKNLRTYHKFGCTHFSKAFIPLPYIPGPNAGPPPSPECQREYSEILGSALYPGVITRADITLASSVFHGHFCMVNPSNEHLFFGEATSWIPIQYEVLCNSIYLNSRSHWSQCVSGLLRRVLCRWLHEFVCYV